MQRAQRWSSSRSSHGGPTAKSGAPRWYTHELPTGRPRIQVTIDEELADALAQVDPHGRPRSQVIRDLAVRGAHAVAEERDARVSATAVLFEVLDGSERFDLGAAAELHAARGERLP